MKISDIINTSIAIILTAVGIILGRSYVGAYLLIIIAVAMLLIGFGRHIFIFLPKIYLTKESAGKAASRIYDEAAENGGQLIATHIRPQELTPKEDYAVNKLKSVRTTLIYRRFILIDDKQLESEWVDNTLAELDPKIEASIYVLDSSSETSSVYLELLPRANLLLYNKEKRYICLFGLDTLRTTDPRYKLVNFAVEFHTPGVFQTLYRYFESITAHRDIKRLKTLEERKSGLDRDVLKPEIQSVLNSLVAFGKQSSDVLHIGVFGKVSLYLNGIKKIEDIEEHESDVDVMIIINPGAKNKIKNKISQIFSSPKVEIVWGDDLDYFYHFRTEGKVTLDIEIHERGTDFYVQHPLLGCSIFAFYKILLKHSGQYIEDILRLPYGFSMNDRFNKLISDRKGLNEFKERLEKNSVEIDPRRVVSLCIKNMSWAITGSRPLNTKVAFDFLSDRWNDMFPSLSLEEARNLLLKSQTDIRQKYREYQNFTKRVISDALQFCSSHFRK